MKKYYKLILIILAFIGILLITNTCEAADTNLTVSASGNTVQATVTVNAATWNLKVKGSNGLNLNGSDNSFSELNNTSGNISRQKTFSFTASGPGEYTVTLTGDITEFNGFKNTIINIPKNVTVKASTTNNNNNNNNRPDDDDLPTASNGGPTTVKSTNNYLKSLKLSTGGINFDKKTTKYTVNVPEETESITVTGTAEHEKATVKGNGEVKLEKGNNTVHVVVTAENGSARTYTLTIIRAGAEPTEEQNEEQNPEEVQGLTSLKLKGVKDNGEIIELLLTPEFSKDVFYYECELPEGITFIDIEQECDILDAIVEITGNENLVDGENLINIIIKYADENGEEQSITYQIVAKKQATGITQEITEEKTGLSPLQIGIIAGSISIALIIIILLIIKYRKQHKNDDEDYDEYDFGKYGEPFYKEEEEDEIFEKPIGEKKEEVIEESQEEEEKVEEQKEKEEQEKMALEKEKNENPELEQWNDIEPVKRKKRFGRNAKKGKHF